MSLPGHTSGPRRSLGLYFDDIVAGEPSPVVKNNELVVAATYGDFERVSKLVTSGADVHTGNDRPLQVAAANGHLTTVEFLLDHEADVNADDDEALVSAAKGGYADVVTLLLRHGANAQARSCASLTLATERRVQTPGSFRARRPTPENGHTETIEVLRTFLADPFVLG
jgi:ankyrin repeat protein